MKKNIIIHGLIAGLIVSSLMLYTMTNLSYCEGNVDFGTSMLIGYASMIIAFSLVFVGIRNFRNNQGNGSISFGKAFSIGGLIVLVASTMYVISWLIDYYFFIPDFMDKYAEHTISEMKASGASETAISDQMKEMEEFKVMYQNPLFNAMMTYMEILPVGLVVTLISALILKRKPVASGV